MGGKLKEVGPGQPVYTLVPVAANRFSIEGAPSGFFIQFEITEGKVKSLRSRASPYCLSSKTKRSPQVGVKGHQQDQFDMKEMVFGVRDRMTDHSSNSTDYLPGGKEK